MTDDLIAWLRAQLDDDEQAEPDVHTLDCELTMTAGFNGPCTCGWTARRRRELKAKRAIIAEHCDNGRGACLGCGLTNDDRHVSGIDDCPTLLAVASVYSDRPGYRDEWRLT